MTADRFRKMALEYPGAVESSHMNHPDFRIEAKIFATLGYPDEDWGMIKLLPDQQHKMVEAFPEAFVPCNGAWGRRGYTNVLLKSAPQELVRAALDFAVGNFILLSGKKDRKPARRSHKSH